MPKVDNEIDRLYQLPLGEFTAARNALVKSRPGAGAAAIRSLIKPVLPAWVVNQLYWKRRPVFDTLVAAAAARRTAYGKRLAGKDADVEGADEKHRAAVRAASEEIRRLLSEAGESATPATWHAIHETLEALPGSETPGRLSKPLKLAGFEALAGLVPAAALSAVVRAAEPAKADSRRGLAEGARDRAIASQDAAARKRAEAAHKRAVAEAEQALGEARRQQAHADTALTTARRELQRATEALDRIQEQLQFATRTREAAKVDVQKAEAAAKNAAGAVDRRETELGSLKQEETGS